MTIRIVSPVSIKKTGLQTVEKPQFAIKSQFYEDSMGAGPQCGRRRARARSLTEKRHFLYKLKNLLILV